MTFYSSDFEETEIEKDETDFDIVIVGAGLSGLTAANRLIDAGLNILILEQTGFTGGRLLTSETSRSFYAHELQSRLNEIIQRLNLSRKFEKFQNARKIVHLDKNKILNDDLPFYVSGEVYLFLKTIDSISKNTYFKTYRKERLNKILSNTTIEDVLCHLIFFKKSRAICRNLIYATCGITQLRYISTLWYFVMLNGAGGFLQRLRINLGDNNRFFIQGGAMKLAQVLTRNINKKNQILYYESVKKIQFNDDRSYIWTNNGRYKCYYVIVAIPPIESSQICIEPLVPLNINEAQSSYYKENNIFFNGKISQLTQIYSLTKNVIGIENCDTNLRLAYDATCSEENDFYISGFLSKRNTNPIIKINFIRALNQYFKSNILNFEDYIETNCALISGGSPMNVLKPGNLKTHLNFLLETHGRVFFTVSEYAKNWPGTIDGAIEAGESAACSVLECIRPQSINKEEWILNQLKNNFYNFFNYFY